MRFRRAFSWLKRLRFLLSKSFFVSWGIAFAFLMGVFSSLAQLLPDFRLSLRLSFALIGVSAGIGTVYAFRKNRPVHLSADDLLPDTLSLGPALSLECSSDRNAIAQVLDLAKEVYPGFTPPTLERYQQFVSVNPTILVCLFNSTREVIGYFDVYPLRADFCDLLVNGSRGELDVRKDHILSPKDAWLAKRLYLAGLATKDAATIHGKRNATILFWGLIKYLQRFYGAPSDRELFAEGVTESGRVILRKLGFSFESPATGRKDPYPLFKASLTSEMIGKAITAVPDFSNTCRLRWLEPGR
jgi:hypothetical protein